MLTSVIFLSTLLVSAATASPLEARSTCHPDFEGAILTVANYGTIPAWSFKWSSNPAAGSPVIANTSPSRWYFQQNGDYDPPTYTVKNVDNGHVEFCEQPLRACVPLRASICICVCECDIICERDMIESSSRIKSANSA